MSDICYTYTCRGVVTNPDPVGKARYCDECRDMLDAHDAACEEIGIEAWDETFVVFRAGVLFARKNANDN